MRTIAHISDLHFGCEDARVRQALCADLRQIAPALVVVSGDLTQRARARQFMAARHFLEQLPAEWLAIPGNHDIPLFDVVRRFLFPVHRFHRWIGPSLNPFYEDADLLVQGINTARSLTWKNGRISHMQMLLIKERFCRGAPHQFKVVVTHHPFIPPPGKSEGAVRLVGRAREALKILDECQVDLVLAGHLHRGYTGDVRTHHPATRSSIIAVQAGTAISRRLRDEPNAYNVITFDRDQVHIAIRVCECDLFRESRRITYRLEGEEWKLCRGEGRG